jgi:hypothetical protein
MHVAYDQVLNERFTTAVPRLSSLLGESRTRLDAHFMDSVCCRRVGRGVRRLRVRRPRILGVDIRGRRGVVLDRHR